MRNLDWLIQHRFQSLVHREFDWEFVFDGEVNLVAGCLWRLIEGGRIRITSQDDGHRFGLPAPLDAAAEVTTRLSVATVVKVELRDGTLDLQIHFNTGHVVELIPNSAGYEAWDLNSESQRFIAVGGGELAVFDDGQ